MSEAAERTFVMVKPDGMHRGLAGEVVSRLEDRGLKLVAARLREIDRDLAEQHYAEHRDKPFFEGLIEFITSGPVLATAWEGADATRQVRRMMGATDPGDAAPGTIRGDYGLDLGRNIIHGADHEDPGANERELDLFFDESDFVSYERNDEAWIYE